MPVHLTAAQARALRLDPGRTRPLPPGADTATGKPPPRRGEPGLDLRCHDCGELVNGETAQRRHLDATGHRRYDWRPDA